MTRDEFGYRYRAYSASGNLIDSIDAVYPAQYDAIPYDDTNTTTPTTCESVGGFVQGAGETTGEVGATLTGVGAEIGSAVATFAKAGTILTIARHTETGVETGSSLLGTDGGITLGGTLYDGASWGNNQGARMWGGLAQSLCEMFEDDITEAPPGPGGLEELKPVLDTAAAQMCMVCNAYEAVASNPSETVEEDPEDDHTIVVYGDSVATENVCTVYTLVPGEADSNGFCID